MFLVTNLRWEWKNNQMALADQQIDVDLLAGETQVSTGVSGRCPHSDHEP
jgi:hypothetical protein